MSQNEKVLNRLKQTPNQWVSMIDLARIAESYAINSRAADLRKQGHIIENKTERVDGKTYSYYRILEGQPELF